MQRQHLAAEDPAVLGERVGHLDVPGGAHAAAEHLLLAREDPAHGAPGLEREHRGERLGGRVDLAAEAAADRAADELDAAGRPLEVLGEHAHREVHRLRAGVDGQPAVALGHDQAALRLDRGLLDRARAVGALDDHIGLLEGRVHVALGDLAVVVGVVEEDVALVGHLRLAGIEGLADVEERLAHLVLHVDQVERLDRRRLVDSRHAADQLALEANLVLGEVRLVGRDAERLEMADDVLRHVLVGRHGEHAGMRLGPRRVDADDARAVVRRAQALAGEHALGRLVGHVLRAPGDVGDPVVAGESSADGLHTEPAFATDSTASRILT